MVIIRPNAQNRIPTIRSFAENLTDMELKIKYEDIIGRCEQLSSFEARDKVDEAGVSRYLDIHINEIDKLLVRQYIDQARALLEQSMERMIDNVVTRDNEYFIWAIRPDKRWKPSPTFNRHIEEALVSYAMSEWLRDKLVERSKFYEALFTASTGMAVKNIFTKQPPKYE